MLRDVLDRLAALGGLIVASPVLGAAALAIAVEDGSPVFFSQTRIGRNGRPFLLYKLRSMRTGKAGTRITAGTDARITRTGRFLRRYKLDELPQLWNVVRGDMSLIGPRPEVPAFVDAQDPAWIVVLSVKPGISDLATLVYRDEEQILSSAADPEQMYRTSVLPDKLALNALYLRQRGLRSDLKLLLATVRYSFFPAGFDADAVRRAFLRSTT
ncbi:MAG TPA: sugar transferase [Bryobacteraceae bacterium]|nr:sugar transferase [Bryobacteraceae bacterium]